MGNENRPKNVYCIVKSATMRKKDGSFVCSIPFGSPFRMLSKIDGGFLYGEVYIAGKHGNIKYRGFVNASGFSKNRVIDMSYLYYRNNTGQRIPVTMRYKGTASGWIEANEQIHVLAKVDDWVLTGKGWTKEKWLTKVRTIFDYESMKNLAYAVITQTVKDYYAIVRGLKANIRYYSRDYTDTIAEMRLIREWFKEGNYMKIIDDPYSGEERLEMLDKELGVTKEWVKETLSKKKLKVP